MSVENREQCSSCGEVESKDSMVSLACSTLGHRSSGRAGTQGAREVGYWKASLCSQKPGP